MPSSPPPLPLLTSQHTVGPSTPSSTTERTSGGTAKRSRSDSSSSTDDEKVNGSVQNVDTPENVGSANWSGWAELENDPIVFTTLLREWGVAHVQVNEVVPLDTIFDISPDDVFGLIFLSRWTPAEAHNDAEKVPTDIWFANQISPFSCATIAIMNIINNRPDIDLGWRLNEFREATVGLPPKERGVALDRFQLVKDVHNSFASDIDKMNVDLRLKQDAQTAAKKKAAACKLKPSPKRRQKVVADVEEDDNGFHFVAYVPAKGVVWRMDGMEAAPRSLCTLSEGDNWLALILPDLQSRWETATTSQLEFSLLSLTSSTDVSSIEDDQVRMQRVREDWGPFIAHMVKLHAERGDIRETLL